MKKHFPACIAMTLLFVLVLSAACARVAWLDDLEEAQKESKKSDKQILAIFTSQKANMLCARITQETISSPIFTKEASQHFVLLNLDFPPGHDEAMLQRYGIYQLPAVLLLDSNGRSFASSDYSGEEGALWLAQITQLDSQRQERDEILKTAARETDHGKRLEAFVAAINTFSRWGIIGNFPELKSEVILLDEENKAGLRAKYSVERAIGDISAAYLATNGMAAGIGALKELLGAYPQGEAAQQI